ncbi:MAG: aldehyde ferredoxin oxidoreductase, partial [Firmicutes bacterium]|nr:aldehyde ferredoxin oxidoreductase [Bacillota bacterium]
MVDLSRKQGWAEQIPPDELKMFLGGRGLNARVLYADLEEGIDPLGDENVICFGAGLLTGTPAPSSGRYNVSALSPATGFFGDANSGGFWGPELKFAGFDQVVVRGRSRTPVYLFINNDQISVRDAGHLWGKDVWEAERALKAETGDSGIQIAGIGPAGENLVPFAAVINNLARAAGRTGMGAVMGAKKLKAVVVRGTRGVGVFDLKRLQKVSASLFKEMQKANSWGLRSTQGTAMLIELYNAMGVLPTNNTRLSFFKKAADINGRKLMNLYAVKPKSCFGCPVHCSHYYKVNEGEFAGTAGEGPEFETMCVFGSRCGNDNLPSILKLNNLCNQYGLDTISAGAVVSYAMECYEKGLITASDTDGLELDWGNYRAIIELVRKIAYREGFGSLLALGVE